ncbi:unnamed protein product [Rhizophagus irregularis]|nr:unnamed protein product [Rhizophagus irregularis]
MIFRCFDFRKRETERNAGRLDNVFRNEPIPDVWMMNFETNRFRTEIRNEPIPDVWMMETNRNAGRNFWVKDPRLRLQDEISKFIFRSPSVRKNFEGSRVPFQHFEG